MDAAIASPRRAAPAPRRLALPHGADALRLPARPLPAPAAVSLLWHGLLRHLGHAEAAALPCPG